MTRDPGLASWLQLSLTPGLGAGAIRGMLRQVGLPQAVLERRRSELTAHAAPAVIEALDSPSVRDAVARALDWAGAPGHDVVTLADEHYPRALLETPDPPPVLYALGRTELLQRPSLAVVGSRNATAQGEHNAESFAKALSNAGLAIVSGLAIGIDAAAHRGALAGASSTIAVLGAFRRSSCASAVESSASASEIAKGLLAHMGRDRLDVDSLCARAGMSAEQVSSELLRLELDGRVTALPGGLFQRLEKGKRA